MYKLRDDGYANFKKIMNGRKWVGRVSRTTGGFLGKIGITKPKRLRSRRRFVKLWRRFAANTAEAIPESRVMSRQMPTVQADTERVIQWLRELSQHQ